MEASFFRNCFHMNKNRFNFKYGDITLTDDFCKIEKKRSFSFVDFL